MKTKLKHYVVSYSRQSVALLLVLWLCASISAQSTLLVEAESFSSKGGWVVDQQFIDYMGSSYLLAHGMGVPVTDATANVTFPKTGTFHVFIRTRDWVAPQGPGKFKLAVNGTTLDTVFGIRGNGSWGWHYGGAVNIVTTQATLTLKDLSGFEGRCDAILFSESPDPVLPNTPDELRVWRKTLLGIQSQPKDEGFYDVVIVGGGTAGICAAVSSARLGLKVALVQDRPVLGGNNSSEVRVHLGGQTRLAPNPVLGEIMEELQPSSWPNPENADVAEKFYDSRKLGIVQAEKNITLFLNHYVFDVIKKADGNSCIVGVISRHTLNNTEHLFRGFLFVDCTGDGTVGYQAGADFSYGRESKTAYSESMALDSADSLTMGMSNQWVAEPAPGAVYFPAVPWAFAIPTDKNQAFYETLKTAFDWNTRIWGEWFWEGGMPKNKFTRMEEIRDCNFRAIYGYWYWLANFSSGKTKYANWHLTWVAYVTGKRESRRLLGDVILKEQDLRNSVSYPDAAVTATWSIDLHLPNTTNFADFGENAFISDAHYTNTPNYPIPYRCFYSRNIPNLFMAGRNISVSHIALGKVRVMRTTAMMGEVVGRAAHIARKKVTTPRGVYQNHLSELKSWFGKAAKWDSSYMALPDSILNPFGTAITIAGKIAPRESISLLRLQGKTFIRYKTSSEKKPATMHIYDTRGVLRYSRTLASLEGLLRLPEISDNGAPIPPGLYAVTIAGKSLAMVIKR